MPTVKFAISAYVADGTTTDYLITWDYLDDDHITVYVDGTPNADPQANHTFTKLNNTTLRITDGVGGAIASGAEIEIRRETPLLTRAITFADGSALLAEDLNKNSDYLLYSMQEVLDTVDAAAQDGALAAEAATEALRDDTQVIRDEAEALKNTTEGYKNTAGTYLATVQSDATDADNHRIAAGASEVAAATSEANSATSATNSANSATASANSATASAASEAASLASEQASAASENAAATSESNAATSATLAEVARTNAISNALAAAASYDSFDDRYLGAKATAPTLDNDGDALQTGALYWNSNGDTMFVWNGTTWDTLNSTTGLADNSTSAQLTLTDTEITSAPILRLNSGLIIDASTEPTGVAGRIWYDADNRAMKHYDGTSWLQMSNKFSAEGGTEYTITIGGYPYKVHKFTSSGTFTAQSTGGVDMFLVAGGGGGGGDNGGGGGAGGLLIDLSVTINQGSYPVVIGAGAVGRVGSSTYYNGANTTAFGRTALGGGKGSSQSLSGGVGGSGGGGTWDTTGSAGTAGQGNRGGNSVKDGAQGPGGGGGGASQNGQNGTASDRNGNGGNGTDLSGYLGSSQGDGGYFAGGGAGGCDNYENSAFFVVSGFGVGGLGGGASVNATQSRRNVGPNADANTGGGGCGGAHTSSPSSGTSNQDGGNGGSGIVYIRYPV